MSFAGISTNASTTYSTHNITTPSSHASSLTNNGESNHPFRSGIILATFSFITLLLIIPPMLWHFHNRNIGATALVAWLITILFFNFINALIWPTDNFATWYNGVGLCDVEVKIQVAAQVALPASFACILRALAAVMDTERAMLVKTKAQRRRGYAVDLLWCVGFPALQMVGHFIVQPYRYYIYGISGCTPAISENWLTVLLMVVPPMVWVLVNMSYAVLVLIRLYRYRVNFNSILASSNTTRSRFMRLCLICLIWLICSLPLETYILYRNTLAKMQPFHWSEVHNAKSWSQLIYVESHGHVLYDRWIPLAFGIIVFIFFGLGKEAIGMYKSCLAAIGLGKCLPTLRSTDQTATERTSSSLGNKAKALLKERMLLSWSTSSRDSSSSPTSTITELSSPRREGPIDKDPFELASLMGEKATVSSTISTGSSLTWADQRGNMERSNEVLVGKEVRQSSECA